MCPRKANFSLYDNIHLHSVSISLYRIHSNSKYFTLFLLPYKTQGRTSFGHKFPDLRECDIVHFFFCCCLRIIWNSQICHLVIGFSRKQNLSAHTQLYAENYRFSSIQLKSTAVDLNYSAIPSLLFCRTVNGQNYFKVFKWRELSAAARHVNCEHMYCQQVWECVRQARGLLSSYLEHF